MASSPDLRSAVAVIGLGCRVPGAESPQQFWRNLRDGVESVRQLSREDLLEAGASPADLANPKHVPVGALVAGMELFDAAFFGIPGREAELLDPQHRLFLECAWETLEDAGCDPARYHGAISVFGGGIFDSYVTWNLLPAGVFDDKPGILQTVLANEKDYMTARVAYKLNLRGTACNVQTGCSTSLVAVHLACQSLMNFESDVALAGGVAVDVARRQGYFYHEGSVYSPDGHCRAFDAEARGTVFGNGVALVALKRFEDAVADGDNIRALILGTATNNDGSLKVGFTAPSVVGQSQVIVEALAAAGVRAESIGYVETHGTGTPLGDPIEIQAMARAFAGRPRAAGTCMIGSVKTNIGHLDAAAGVSGLIKAVLALENRQIPPTLHFRRANPELELHRTPFEVAAALTPWTAGTAPGQPRRAGVSSFGIGGTNAHAILQEAPAPAPAAPSRPRQLILWSAKSDAAAEAAAGRLGAHLRTTEPASLPDVAFTLQTGRSMFAHRRFVVAATAGEAADLLESDAPRAVSHEFSGEPPRIAFMFPGQGAQYPGMAMGLYDTEPVFKQALDACVAALAGEVDLMAALRAPRADGEARLTPTALAQPALFAVEYALAQLWRSWGIEPEAYIGHSLGEYVAACLAGVFTLPDAMKLVAARGRLMQTMPAGAMTAIGVPADRLRIGPDSGLDIAAVNAPALTVVSGPVAAIERFEREQRETGVECRRLHTSHAFHSAAMDPVVSRFAEIVSKVPRRRPERRFVSSVTGTWITDEQATSADYWARHLRAPVLFGAGVNALFSDGVTLLVEVGPGRTLGGLVRAQRPTAAVAWSLPSAVEQSDNHAVLLDGLGRAWQHGVEVKWEAFYAGERRRRVALPAYPFERRRYWIEPDDEEVERKRARQRANEKNPTVEEWLYARCWKQTLPVDVAASAASDEAAWLVIADRSRVSEQVVGALRASAARDRLVVATPASAFGRSADGEYGFDPARSADYDRLVDAVATGASALRVVHLGAAGRGADRRLELERGFYSVSRLGGALWRVRQVPATVKVITSGVDVVTGTETVIPDRAIVSGAALVLPQEQPHVRCQRIDLVAGDGGLSASDSRALAAEILGDAPDALVAIRGGRRWIPGVERLEGEPSHPMLVRAEGHYLIVGGLGTIGFSIACYLASLFRARLTIVNRSDVPPRDEWASWLAAHQPADPTSIRIVKLQVLEKLGGEVSSVAADAADRVRMRDTVAEAERRFGPINGVVVAAGLMDEGSFGPMATLDPAACARHFRPKLEGLPAIEAALANRAPDFVCVASSLSAQLGGVGYAAYAGANAYLDAFVQEHNQRTGDSWMAINWDAWHPVGGQLPPTSLLARLAMTPYEGQRVFELLLKHRGLTQILVSTADLAPRIAEHTERLKSPAPAVADAAAEATLAADVELDADLLSPTQRVVVGIWQDVLGIAGVELHESFLDLGGSSLTAIQVIGRIGEQTGVHVAIEEFIFQTAAQLAALIDARRPAAAPAGVEPSAPAEPAASGSGSRGWSRLRGVLRSRAADETVVPS